MRTDSRRGGFTLVELLMVIAVIAILAAILLPVLSKSRKEAEQTKCLSNIKQINAAVQMYASDNGEWLPTTPNLGPDNKTGTNSFQIYYKALVKGYAGLQGPSSAQDKLFDCPADTFCYGEDDDTYHAESFFQSTNDYTSYGYNGQGGETTPRYAEIDQTNFPGLFGWKLTSLRQPAKTLLLTEAAAVWPWSWHDFHPVPSDQRGINNSQNVVSFPDGHSSYIRMYWDYDYYNLAGCRYDPPDNYDYKWCAD